VSILTAAAATAVAISAQTAASAAPKLTLSQAKTEVAADRKAADEANQQYDDAQSQNQALQQKVSLLQDEISRQQASVNKEAAELGSVATAQYRQGEVDPTVELLLSADPTSYINQASLQGQVEGNQSAQLDQIKSQEATLTREKAEAASELAQEQKLLASMQKSKKDAAAKLAHAQTILNQLTPAQRTTVDATGYGGGTGGGSMTASQVDLSGISSTAATAMRAALGKMGDPYQWAAAGPSAFDCSGLVMWAYAQAGVSLPHSSFGDESVGTAVSYANIKVGDIVVVENGNHVGLYAGNGMILNAPEYGHPVQIDPISWFGSIVAIRRV
jgi:cell wall-associated NlpC family hydrolase